MALASATGTSCPVGGTWWGEKLRFSMHSQHTYTHTHSDKTWETLQALGRLTFHTCHHRRDRECNGTLPLHRWCRPEIAFHWPSLSRLGREFVMARDASSLRDVGTDRVHLSRPIWMYSTMKCHQEDNEGRKRRGRRGIKEIHYGITSLESRARCFTPQTGNWGRALGGSGGTKMERERRLQRQKLHRLRW